MVGNGVRHGDKSIKKLRTRKSFKTLKGFKTFKGFFLQVRLWEIRKLSDAEGTEEEGGHGERLRGNEVFEVL